MVRSLSHPGVQASVKLVGSKFVWSGLRKEAREWAAACVVCQRAKVHRHTKAPLEPFTIPTSRLKRACGPGGPFDPSQGFTHGGRSNDAVARGSSIIHP